ncbi:MAG: alpha/beta fold hydrolase [Alphaproteobacteria bacterium]
MDSFEVDGSVLRCQTAGTGAPLIFVHGSAGSGRQWKRLYDHFAASRRVFAFDLEGNGGNPPWPVDRTFTVDCDRRAIDAAIDQIGAPVDVIAHSAGCLGTLLLARDRPAAIRSLTLFEPVLFHILRDSDPAAFAPVRAFAERYRATYAAAGGAAAMEAFVDFWNGPGSWPTLPEPVRASMLVAAGRLDQEWGVVLGAQPVLSLADLTAIRQPTLFFCGTGTIGPVQRIAEIAAPIFPAGRLIPVEGAGHMAPFTHAAAVAPAIAAHIEGVVRQ